MRHYNEREKWLQMQNGIFKNNIRFLFNTIKFEEHFYELLCFMDMIFHT